MTGTAQGTGLQDRGDVEPGTGGRAVPEAGPRIRLPPDIRRVLLARSLRAFGDGYVAILLPLHLSRLGYDAFGVGVDLDGHVAGLGPADAGPRAGCLPDPAAPRPARRGAPDGGDGTGLCRARRLLAAARDRLRRNAEPVRRRRQRVPAARTHRGRACGGGRGADGGVRPLQLRRGVLRGARSAVRRHGGLALAAHRTGHHDQRSSSVSTGASGCSRSCSTAISRPRWKPAPTTRRHRSDRHAGSSTGSAALFSVDAFGGGFVINALLALWLSERFGISVATIGAIFFVTGLCSAVSYFAAVPLARRFGLINTMVFTHLPSSLFLILTAFAPTVWVAFGLLILRSLLSQMDVPTRSSYVMAVVRPEERPAAASVTAVPRSLAVGRRAAPVRMAADRDAVRLAARPRRHHQGGLRSDAAAAVLGHQAAGGTLTVRFESHAGGHRLRFGGLKRLSMMRMAAKVTIASERCP